MTVSRYLIIFTLSIFTFASTASCQANRNKNADSTQILRSSRQIFRDSIPAPTGYVNDYENIFTGTEEERLDSLINDFQKRTTIQIAVVTIDTTMTTPDSLDALTLRIANTWGLGQKDKNNGVLIGISKGHRKMSIQNGYGIEAILSDQETKQIIDTAFIPGYREGKYFSGTFEGLKTLMAILENRYQ